MVGITLDQYLFTPLFHQQRKYISFLKIAIGRDYNSQKCPNIFKFTKLSSFPFLYLWVGGGGVSARIL